MLNSTMKPVGRVAKFVRWGVTALSAIATCSLMLGACTMSDAECRALCEERICGRPISSDCPATACGQCAGSFCTVDGTCTPELDMSSLWIVQATEGSVSGDDWDCISCDPAFDPDCDPDQTCNPDPFLWILHDKNGNDAIDEDEVQSSYVTSKEQNTFDPVWNEDTLVLSAAELMGNGLIVAFQDDDSPFSDDDNICIKFVTFTSNDFSAAESTFSCTDGSFYTLALWPTSG